MDAEVQSRNQTAIGSMEAHRLTATEEILGYRQCWENDGCHVLGQRRRDTHSLRSQEHNSDGWDLLRCVTNEVSTSIAWKTVQKAAAVLFHHDNAPPNWAACVHQFFEDNNFEVVPHAPYSPDLAPSDFWLFPTLKNTLHGRTFSSLSALATATFQWSQRTPKEAFAAAMQSWRQRCEKCVCLQGNYVEKWLQFQLPRMSNFF